MTAHWIVPRRAPRLSAPALFGSLWKLDRFFGDLPLVEPAASAAPEFAFAPAVSVEETHDELRLSAELPGLEKDDFEVTTDGDLLTIKGEKKIEITSDENDRRRTERSSGRFEHSFRVTWEIDPDSVKAVYKNGVLELVLPKPEQEPARTIPVTGS